MDLELWSLLENYWLRNFILNGPNSIKKLIISWKLIRGWSTDLWINCSMECPFWGSLEFRINYKITSNLLLRAWGVEVSRSGWLLVIRWKQLSALVDPVAYKGPLRLISKSVKCLMKQSGLISGQMSKIISVKYSLLTEKVLPSSSKISKYQKISLILQ